MGGCFSKKKKKKKKKKDDPSSSPRDRGGGGRKGQKTAAAATSRDPPPTESPQEEKVKEVLSETPKITRQNSNNKKKRDSDRGSCGRDTLGDRSEVSEEFSAASTTLTETTRAAGDGEEGEAEEIEMKKMSPAVTRSRSPAKLQKKINRSDFIVKDAHRPAVAAGKREIRGGVDVGCRSARSSSSPAMAMVRAREKGNVAAGNCIASSGAAGHNNYKMRSDVGERSGRRSLSPAMKRSVSAAPAMDQRQCRSSTNNNLSAKASTRANINGRFSPQRVPPPPARVMHLEDARRGQGGNNAAVAGGEDGNVFKAKESMENPLVSMECFIFL